MIPLGWRIHRGHRRRLASILHVSFHFGRQRRRWGALHFAQRLPTTYRRCVLGPITRSPRDLAISDDALDKSFGVRLPKSGLWMRGAKRLAARLLRRFRKPHLDIPHHFEVLLRQRADFNRERSLTRFDGEGAVEPILVLLDLVHWVL